MPAERDDGHLARATADVDHHPPDRLGDVQARADRGGDRLLDQVHTTRPGRERGLLDRPLLDLGDPRRRAHDQTGVGPMSVEHLADEVAQHLLGDLEVRDHAVAQRARRRDRRRRATDHPLGVGSHGVDRARSASPIATTEGSETTMPASSDVDEGVRRAEVDRHVPHPERGSDWRRETSRREPSLRKRIGSASQTRRDDGSACDRRRATRRTREPRLSHRCE